MTMKTLALIGSLTILSTFSISQQPGITQLENGLFSINHENLTFLINPALGARVISAKVGEKELLLQGRKELLNFGATFWPSPQSDWNWPPPTSFHFGPYSSELSGNTLVLKSEVDPKLGLQVVKTFSFNVEKHCLDIDYQIINKTSGTVSVGPWEIVCVPASGSKVFFPRGYVPEHTNTTLTFQNYDGINWFDFDPEKLKEHQKLFNNASEGWLAHINADGLLFIKTFGKIPAEKLAPGQGNVEVYATKGLGYIELENHGEFRHLAPGESLEYHVKWYLSELPKTMKSDEMNTALLEHVKSIIN